MMPSPGLIGFLDWVFLGFRQPFFAGLIADQFIRYREKPGPKKISQTWGLKFRMVHG